MKKGDAKMTTEFLWRIVPLTEEHGRQICTWSYPPPYHIYNWPIWEHMVKEDLQFANPALRIEQFAAVINEQEQLCGFAQFFPIVGVTRLGLGLRPDLVGQGLGSKLAALLVQEAKRRTPDHVIDLEVLTWNVRAQRSYRESGFTHTDTYIRMTPNGFAAFYCMVYTGDPL
jgi:ribosomal-protein-alanine N-acetyltransferase